MNFSGALSPSEWRPVGQGNPLIDPTNVYSPPMVEHVHYWLEPLHRPRIDLPGTNNGPPLGFAQAQHYKKYSHHGESGLYGSSTYGPFKELQLEQYGSNYSPTSFQQNYGFQLRNNPNPYSGNYAPSYDSLQSFSSNSAVRAEPQRLSVKEHFSQPVDEKQLFTQMSTTLSPSGQPDSHPLSLSLQPPPQHAITLGQVAGWPHISTHLHPNNYPSSSSAPITSNATPTFVSATEPTSTATTSTATTTTKAPPTAPPVSLVIEGHSKVKKYGPLPESSNSVHMINHNHLTSKKVCDHCIDLPVAKAKEIAKLS